MEIEQVWLILPVAAISLLLTGVLRRYAMARSLLDLPGTRSSHAVPTPRGGGMAIVVSFMAVLPVLGFWGLLPWSAVWALVGAGGLVAGVGFLDDHGHIAARWRLLAHFVAAGWALAWLGGAPPLAWDDVQSGRGWLGAGLTTVYLVWLLNLYNFMDGIDGIAGGEAISVGGGGAALYWALGNPDLAVAPMLLAAAAAGFLVWNFPPARIFMGDVGSGFLGIVLGVLSLQAAWVEPELFWSWMILLGVFVVDATVTLLRRLLTGARVYEAHCSHAYQHAARHFGRHLPVTLAVLVINLLWLFPLALGVALGHLPGVWGVALAYLPLILVAVKFKAGMAERV